MTRGYFISGYYMENKVPITAKMGDKYAGYDNLATHFWRFSASFTNSLRRRLSIKTYN
jgi:hypothetical protein